MFMKRSIPELVRMLNHYTDMYDQGHPEISDKEWDDLYFELVQMEKEAGYVLPDSPLIILALFSLQLLQETYLARYFS